MTPGRRDDDPFEQDELTPVSADPMTNILVHVGATRSSIASMRTEMSGMRKDIRDLTKDTVSKKDCESRHKPVEESVNALAGEVKTLATAVTSIDSKLDVVRTEVKNGHSEPLRKKVSFWITLGLLVLGAVGSGALGLMKLGSYLDRVDRAVARSASATDRVQDELQRVASTKVVYVRVPTDAGVAAEPARPPRRRRRASP